MFKIHGTYGFLFIGILLLSGFAQKCEPSNTEINSQALSTVVSSQSDKSKNQSSSDAESSSKAEAISKANPESIAASVKAASENATRASAAEEASKAVEAKSIAQQTIEQPAPQNDTGRTVFVTGGGKSNVYWYSTSSMPARTNKNNIITMTEADALAQGKRHSMTE